MSHHLKSALRKTESISASSYSIYDSILVGDKELWLTSRELEALFEEKMKGTSLKGLKLRTRSKEVKKLIAKALGYPVPKSFKKTQPRFPGQNLDVYTQKSNNLQIWNEDLDATRRYVLIKIGEDDVISKVKVVMGADLAPLDTTGTLTQKYQASFKDISDDTNELVNEEDTPYLRPLCSKRSFSLSEFNPTDAPVKGKVLSIKTIYSRLKRLVGERFEDPGSDQERNRGAALHELVCKALGFASYKDSGVFPDIRNQLLEVKLQTSATIDLGLISPDSLEALDMDRINNTSIRHCDVRYAIFGAIIKSGQVKITSLVLTNGQEFFSRFRQFEGKKLNKKIQIPLPPDYFD